MALRGFTKKSKAFQYTFCILVILVVSGICFLVKDLIGYRTVALLLLFSVSLLAVLVDVFPVFVAAVLSALIWDFFFIPPFYTFQVNNMEDALMLIMYFIIALLSGILTTKIRQYEKQIQAREEKINTIKLYNTLLNSVSHELRTPMTTIIGISENLMYNNDNLKSEERLMLNKEVFIAGNRLNRLVDNLLDMSRLESGFLKLRYDWCDVHDLINSLTKKLEKELSAHSLRVDIPEDIPLIKIDRVLFEQALFNILHNATVYTPAGSNIDLQVTILNEQLKIVIADNGPGFATGDAEQLFEKFYRGKEKKTGGLGLGLSIAKGFILAHNGSISIKNRSTGGAEIQILIPVEKTQMDIYHE